MDVVPDADRQLRLASAVDVCLLLTCLADIVLSNCFGKASEKWSLTLRVGAIVDCK